MSWDMARADALVSCSHESNQGLLSQNVSLIMSTWPISIWAFCFLFRSFSRWVLLVAFESLDTILSRRYDWSLSLFSYYIKSHN